MSVRLMRFKNRLLFIEHLYTYYFAFAIISCICINFGSDPAQQ